MQTEGFLCYFGRSLKSGYFFNRERPQRSNNLRKLRNPTIKYPRMQKQHHIDTNKYFMSLDVSGDVEVRVRPVSLVNVFLMCNLFQHILMLIQEESNCTLK